MSDGSNLKGKLAIAGVSFLGTLGLALSALYLIGAVLNFVPGYSTLSRFMIGTKEEISYGFTLLVIPYVLTMAHLYFRSQLAHWLFNQEYFDLAKAFCEKRQTHSLLRSRAEALANKSILLALLIRDGKWSEAKDFFELEEPRRKNAFYWRWMGWGAELYWRTDDMGSLKKLFGKAEKSGKRAERYDAVKAHYLFETKEVDSAKEILAEQSWNKIPGRVAIVSSIIESKDSDEIAWGKYVAQIPSAKNERAILFSSPVEIGGDDARTLRLISERAQDKS